MTIVNYSIIVPVYKSSKSLFTLAEQVENLFNTQMQGECCELIFVNDSPFEADTCNALDLLYDKYPFVKIIQLTQNFGQSSAVLCGIENSVGEYIVTLDDDMQHDPMDIALLAAQKHHDIVIAKFLNKQHGLFKKLTSSIKGYFDYLILGKPKSIKLTPFRLFNRMIADNLLKIGTSYPFIPALLFAVSKDVINVEVPHYPRKEGKSNYTLKKMIGLFKNLLINNSSLMLRWIGNFGLFILSTSLIYAGVIVYRNLFMGASVQGWSSIMIAILFFGGTIMFTLGIIGEYLIRIIHTSENRPHYFVKSIKDTKHE